MAFVRVNKCNNKKLKCGPSLRRGSRIPWETGMRDDMAYGSHMLLFVHIFLQVSIIVKFPFLFTPQPP